MNRSTLIAFGVAVILVVYLLSPPFVMLATLNLAPPWRHAIGLFYEPASWLGLHCPAYQKLMISLLRYLHGPPVQIDGTLFD